MPRSRDDPGAMGRVWLSVTMGTASEASTEVDAVASSSPLLRWRASEAMVEASAANKSFPFIGVSVLLIRNYEKYDIVK